MRRIFLFVMALAMLLAVVTGLNAKEVTTGYGAHNARYPGADAIIGTTIPITNQPRSI